MARHSWGCCAEHSRRIHGNSQFHAHINYWTFQRGRSNDKLRWILRIKGRKPRCVLGAWGAALLPPRHTPPPQRGGSKRGMKAAWQHNRPASLDLTDAKWTCLPRVCAPTISFLEGNTFLGENRLFLSWLVSSRQSIPHPLYPQKPWARINERSKGWGMCVCVCAAWGASGWSERMMKHRRRMSKRQDADALVGRINGEMTPRRDPPNTRDPFNAAI